VAQERVTNPLRSCRFIIVGELHSFAGNKRRRASLCHQRLENVGGKNQGNLSNWPFGHSATRHACTILGGHGRSFISSQKRKWKEIIVDFLSDQRDPPIAAEYTAFGYTRARQLIARQVGHCVYKRSFRRGTVGLVRPAHLARLKSITRHSTGVRLEVEDRLKMASCARWYYSTNLELNRHQYRRSCRKTATPKRIMHSAGRSVIR
jgi:hypothetical protein